jgi:triacylglycerol lipase
MVVVVVLGLASFGPPARADCPGHLQHCSPGPANPVVNDPACESSVPPVVLVHGTFMDQTASWNLFAPALRASGYCVWSVDYGERATMDMEQSVLELLAFVRDIVLPTSSTGTLSAIGHSQGGLQIRHMLRHEPDLPIDDAISLSGSHFGTDTPLAPYAADHAACPACGQQIQGSAWMTSHMNVGDLTPGMASYTQIETVHDEVVTPFTNTLLPEEPGVVTNIVLQDKCPHDAFEHVGIIYDPFALEWALQALSGPGPADPTFVPTACAG